MTMKRRSLALSAFVTLTLGGGVANAQSLRPHILIIFDTSGSMLYANGTSSANDGSPLCGNSANGKTSTIYNLKEAIRAALAQAGSDEANFGLMRFPQIENPTRTPVCPNGHYTIGADNGCRLSSQPTTTAGSSYGTWFDTGFREALVVDVTKRPAGTKPLASDFDPADANLALIFKWLDQTEDTDTVAPIVDPEIRSGSNWRTPLGRSLFYSRLYFDNFIKPVDPKQACRTNTVILVTDGEEYCDTSAPSGLNAETCVPTGSAGSTFHPYTQACLLLKSGVKTYVVTEKSFAATPDAANNQIAKFGGTGAAVGLTLTDTSAVKAALLGIIAKTVPPTEICNGRDENCNGLFDEGVSNNCPYNATTLAHCATETCNCLDDDCDGKIDEGLPPNACGGACGCAVPSELCNYKDDDCDGEVDEGFDAGGSCNNGLKGTCFRTGFITCKPDGSGTVCETEAVNPSEHQSEVCNGLDDDCNGLTDDGDMPGVGLTCGGGAACSSGKLVCVDGKLICNSTTSPQPELCNGVDDDCNGLIDDGTPTIWPWLDQACYCDWDQVTMTRGECRPGALACKDKQVCLGCKGPTPELCDGLDNDCNGLTDDGTNPCGSERFRCNQGRCLLLCQPGEFPCPSGYECQGDFCVPQRCAGVVCYADEKCDNETGKCVGLCHGINCTAPATCVNGVCVTCYNAGYECPDGQRCVGGACQPDRCASLTCAGDEYCADSGEAAGPRCIKVCEVVQCATGQRCIQGVCEDDPCASKVCEQHQFCNPTDGECHQDPCLLRVCPAGQVCVSSTGRCIQDPCDTIACTRCFGCVTTKDGQASCVADPLCDARHVTTATRGSSRPGCTVGGTSSPAGWLVALLLLSFAMLRRRRTVPSYTMRHLMTRCVSWMRPFATVAGLVTFALGGLACQERRYDTGLTVNIDAPVQEVAPMDRVAIDRVQRDIVPHEGLAGDAGECRPNNGGVEICNAIDDDCNGIVDDVDKSLLQIDIANCGTCFHLCNLANANSECQVGKCVITSCLGTTMDTNQKPDDGCECTPSNNKIEICDNQDNNCDGNTDEGFAFLTDVNNCGKCGFLCQFPFAAASCSAGKCQMGACQADFYDRDTNPDTGCEAMCVKTNSGAEVCDGLDNDCDGSTDEGVTPSITCKSAGVCNGTTAACSGAAGWTCAYASPSYQAVEDKSKGCDTLDNDCDGVADEAFAVGKDCTVGKGACMNTGKYICDANIAKCNASPKPPQQEVCNGVDDNCNDLVDEISSAGSSDDQFLVLPAGDGGAAAAVTMFAYEASRYDSTSTNGGFDSNRRPCSLGSRMPWTNVSQDEADAACKRIVNKDGQPMGWRLCTTDEWERACNGNKAIGTATFPYGSTYRPQACNGYDYDAGQPIGTGTATEPVGDAGLQNCVSMVGGDLAYDMSGNVKEWVLTSTAPNAYALRGGAYNTLSFPTGSGSTRTAPGLQCNASTPAPVGVPVRLPSVGFRCCYAGLLPN